MFWGITQFLWRSPLQVFISLPEYLVYLILGSSRKTKVKDTPESSPERTEKMRQAAKARDEARKRLLAERRAAMKQKQQKQAEQDIQIFISEPSQ